MDDAEDRFDRFNEALGIDRCTGESIYGEDKARALYNALVADPKADLEQLTCEICGLPEWQGDCSDMAMDFARDSDNPPANPNDPDEAMQWYLEHHDCEHHSSLAAPAFGGFRARERWEDQMQAIHDALAGDDDDEPAPRLTLVE